MLGAAPTSPPMLRPLALALAASLATCADPAPPPPASDDAELADGVMPDAWEFLQREALPAAPPALPDPPPLDSVALARIGQTDTTAVPGAGVFLNVGIFHGGEAPATDGERWLGLYPTDAGWELAAVTVRVRTVPDPLFGSPGAPEDPPTGAEVTTDRTQRTPTDDGSETYLTDDARFFVRADGLTPGPVATAFAGRWPFEAGAALALELPGGLGAADLDAAGLAGRPHELVLELDGQPVLHHVNRDEGYASLLWAGDLDRDGALDFVLDASDHYNLSAPQLWLSSAADDGAPLGLAARHETTGC